MEAIGFVVAILGFILLDLASLRWGRSSIEGLDSPEWARRRKWRGFSHIS